MGSPKRAYDVFKHEAEADAQFVTAVARAMSILKCFDRGETELGNQEIATRTGLPKPTVSRLTYTLASLGYLTYLPAREKYSLGVGVLALAHAYVKGNDMITTARPLMQELANYTKAAVMLGDSDGSHMVLLEICQGDEIFRLKLERGARVPHSSTALGRASLAAMPRESFDRYVEDLKKQCPSASWPKIRSGIIRAREDYEQYGFCFSFGDWNPDVFAVGVPIVSADRSRTLAFNCSGRVSIVSREQIFSDFGPRLVALRNQVVDLMQGQF
jgi:DNA-binding IclR family transcriptional regulator